MANKSDKPENDEENRKGDKTTKAASGYRDEKGKKSPNLNVIFAKYKGRPTPEDIASLLSTAEKKIRVFFEVVTRRVTQFLEKDLPNLRNVSKEELTKVHEALLEYKAQLEKISQEKMKRVAEMKTKLRTRIMTVEEVQSFVKYFDEKMTEVTKITQSVIDTMRKSKITDSFVTDLQTAVTSYSKKVTTAMDELFAALKAAAEDMGKSLPDKTKLATKMPKMPTNSELQRVPSMFSNIFKRIGGSSSSADDSGKALGGPVPPGTLRAKLPTLNLGKHFNSETLHGRANVAKATYVGALLYFLYWKFKKSKS